VLGEAHNLVFAQSGEEAIATLQRRRDVDLILMDVQMPGLDGLAVTRLLKHSPRTAHIKIVALTALAMKGDAERILAAGCDAYLAKPYHYNDLVLAVQGALA
jgi:two-component system, cell cycle response regulator DivK